MIGIDNIIKQLRMQYEAIRDERRMAANTATRIGDAFLSLLSFGQSFLDVFLRKDVDDTAKGLSLIHI